MLQHWRITLAVAVLAAASFFVGLGSSRLFDEDEAKNAVCGREMFARGDWIVPTYNDQLRTDKPILIYWFMIVSYHVLGVTELAARFPSALAGVGTVVLTFQLGRLMFNVRTGLLASCLAASALMFAVLARGATPDSLLIVCITASITSFVAGVAWRRGGNFSGVTNGLTRGPTPIYEHGLPALACVGIYISMGLAVLAKGPIGVVMPVGIIGTYLLLCDGVEAAPAGSSRLSRIARYFSPWRVLRVIRTLRLGWGLPLVALVALPWYIAVGIKTDGAWLMGFLGTHNVGRFMQPMEHHRGLPIFYPVAIMLGFFPGSVFLPVALWSMVRSVSSRHAPRAVAETRIIAAHLIDGAERAPLQLRHTECAYYDGSAAFLLCWITCYVGFFTLAATKLPNYVVPCYPALAVATGAWLSSAFARATARDWRLWAGFGSLVAAGACAAVAVAITARVLLEMDSWPALPGVVAIVGGIVCMVLLYRGQAPASIAAFAVTCLAFTLSATAYSAYRVSFLEDGPLLAERIHSLAATSDHDSPRVAMFGYSAPTLVYYVGHPVQRISSPEQITAFFDHGGDAIVLPREAYDKHRDLLPSDTTILADRPRFLKKKERVLVVGRKTEVARGSAREQSR